MRSRTAVATLALVVGAAAAADAQGTERPPDLERRPYTARALAPGARVRVELSLPQGHPLAGRRHVTGRLVRLDADSVLIESNDAVIGLPRRGVSTFAMRDRSRSRASAAWRGARTGAVIGAVAGAVLGYLSWEECSPGAFLCPSRSADAAAGGIGGAMAGMVLGGTIGAVRGGERWRRVPIDADTRVGILAAPGGARVGVVLRP